MPVETSEPASTPVEEYSPQQLKTLADGKLHKEAGDKAFKSGDTVQGELLPSWLPHIVYELIL